MNDRITDDICFTCRKDKFMNPNLKILVSLCGHHFCESCIDRYFSVSSTIVCPECNALTLKRTSFVNKTFEDATVELETAHRKRLMKIYNLREEDFSTESEYNNYLEEIEEIVQNLTTNTNVDETKARIDAFREKHQALILINKTKTAEENRELSIRIANEEREAELRASRRRAEDERRRLVLESERRKLEQALLAGQIDETAVQKLLLEAEEKLELEEKTFADRLDIEAQEHLAQGGHAGDSGVMAVGTLDHLLQSQQNDREAMPKEVDPEAKDPRRAAVAGGYTAATAHRRAVSQAFAGLC